MIPLSFLSVSISVSYSFFPSSSLHRSTLAQRVSSGLLVYVILFLIENRKEHGLIFSCLPRVNRSKKCMQICVLVVLDS